MQVEASQTVMLQIEYLYQAIGQTLCCTALLVFVLEAKDEKERKM